VGYKEETKTAQPPLRVGSAGKKAACEIERATEPCSIVIFGASGDLTKRKLLPSLYHLFKSELLPNEFIVVGAGRKSFDDQTYRQEVEKALRFSEKERVKQKSVLSFIKRIYYQKVDYDKIDSFRALDSRLNILEKKGLRGGNRLYYLATPPAIYQLISENLGRAGLSGEDHWWRRIVIEKPFGRDLSSAKALNAGIHRYFREEQVFRIDHYLGKETVQDILMFRFANTIFEPVWNRQYIDHIQITAAETLGVENRAGYYESAGVLRDMFQNHMLQLMALTAMEPPASFDADAVRDEKVKVLKSIRHLPPDEIQGCLITGQYSGGEIEGKAVKAYRDEKGVNADSPTATYAALKLCIDNWRWRGVPFYLRSGKRLKKRHTEIAVRFRHVPHLLFKNLLDDEINPNTLVFTIQPNEGIELTFQAKAPGTKICMRTVTMDFKYADFYHGPIIDSYERVLIDCLSGDHTLFIREDGAIASWKLLTPLIDAIESKEAGVKLYMYRSGSYGPGKADQLIERDGRKWREF